MNKFTRLALPAIMIVPLLSLNVGAQNRNSGATVGQLLKKISEEDRGKGVSFDKGGTSLPQAPKQLPKYREEAKVDLDQVKPPSSSNFLEGAYEGDSQAAALEAILNKQIEKLYALTQKHKNSPNRGELWLRLAELYVEKAGIVEFRIQNSYSKRLEAFNSGKLKSEPRLDLSSAKEYFQKAVQLYSWFVKDFPRDDKVDQALFFLGFNSFELGDTQRGARYYQILTKRFPNSPYVAEAYFALGEYYFEKEQWAKAYSSYLRILKQKDPRLFNFALYKSAWSLFRMGQAQKGLRFMEQLIKSDTRDAEQVEGRKNVSKVRLAEQALRDIVIFYGYSGSPQEAIDFFNRMAPNNSAEYLERLGYFYSDKGNRAAAASILGALIKKDPMSPKAFDYKYQIASNYSYVSTSEDYKRELFEWLEQFGPKSQWYKQNSSDKKLIDTSKNLMEQTLRNHILQAHQTAQDSRAAFSQQRAREGYELYFQQFGDQPKVGEMHFFYGELLYDMKQYKAAAGHYLKSAELDPKGQYFDKAAINAVLALEKTLPPDEEISARVKGTSKPVALDADSERFVKAAEWFLGKFPRHEEAEKIRFRVGRLYYLSNQFDKSREQFNIVVKNSPSSKYSEYSANLILDSYNLQGDSAGLETAAQQLLSVSSLAGSKVGGDIRDVLEKSTFKRAQDLEVAKDYRKSAEEFEKFEAGNRTSELAATALFNAAVNYERAGDSSKALELHGRFLAQKDKKSEHLRPQSARLRAKLLQNRGDYVAAAKAFEDAAGVVEKGDLAPNMYFNAAVLYEGTGNHIKAIENYDRYYKLEKGSEKYDSIWPQAQLMEKAGRSSDAIAMYNEFVVRKAGDRDRVIEAHYNIAQLYRKMGEDGKARSWEKRLLEQQAKFAPNKKGPGAKYAAGLKLAEAEELFGKLKAIKLPTNPKAQEAAAQQKLGLVTELNKRLAEIVKYDSAQEIVAALAILGEVNEHMGDALMNAPLPPGLTAEEKAQYLEGVKGFAQPFFSKAKESYRAAVERGWELETYNEWYRKALSAVERMEEGHHYRGGEIGVDSNLIQWTDI